MVGHHKIGDAVSVNIGNLYGNRVDRPRVKTNCRLEGPVSIAEQHPDAARRWAGSGVDVRGNQIGFAIAVHVGDCNALWLYSARPIGYGLAESSVSVAQQYTHCAGGTAGFTEAIGYNHEIEFSVPLQIRCRNRVGILAAGLVVRRRLESSVSMAQKHAHRACRASVVVTGIRHQQIRRAIPVHIRHGYRVSLIRGGAIGDRGPICPVPDPTQHGHGSIQTVGIPVALVCHHNVRVDVPVQTRQFYRDIPCSARTIGHRCLKSAVAIAQEDTYRTCCAALAGAFIACNHIQPAIAIHIGYGHGVRLLRTRAIGNGVQEGAISPVQEHAYRTVRALVAAGAAGCDHEIGFAVIVEVSHSNRTRILSAGDIHRVGSKSAIAISKKYANRTNRAFVKQVTVVGYG